jgi:membrane protease YdiL (CAAX protease family)
MIASVLGQLLNTAVASKKQMIGPIITKIVLVMIGSILLIAGFAFVLVAIYHALAPEHFTRAEAAGLMAVTLLVVGAIVVLVALKKSNGKPASLAAAATTTDPQLAELTAIQALGMLNKALTDLSKGRGGGTAMIGVLGLAALVGFVSGRKR